MITTRSARTKKLGAKLTDPSTAATVEVDGSSPHEAHESARRRWTELCRGLEFLGDVHCRRFEPEGKVVEA